MAGRQLAGVAPEAAAQWSVTGCTAERGVPGCRADDRPLVGSAHGWVGYVTTAPDDTQARDAHGVFADPAAEERPAYPWWAGVRRGFSHRLVPTASAAARPAYPTGAEHGPGHATPTRAGRSTGSAVMLAVLVALVSGGIALVASGGHSGVGLIVGLIAFAVSLPALTQRGRT